MDPRLEWVLGGYSLSQWGLPGAWGWVLGLSTLLLLSRGRAGYGSQVIGGIAEGTQAGISERVLLKILYGRVIFIVGWGYKTSI